MNKPAAIKETVVIEDTLPVKTHRPDALRCHLTLFNILNKMQAQVPTQAPGEKGIGIQNLSDVPKASLPHTVLLPQDLRWPLGPTHTHIA